MLWEKIMSQPEALIAFFNTVNTPQELTFKDKDFNIVWVLSKAILNFTKS